MPNHSLIQQRSSVIAGSLWMIGVSLVLFFLPGVNGLVGGLVGGYKVGSAGRAFFAAILPAMAMSLALWLLLAIFELPFVGLLAGATVGLLIALADMGLLVGAVLGGAMRTRAN